jgi:hypothetical protein
MDVAIAHLRDVLGDETYESLARKRERLTKFRVPGRPTVRDL